MKTQIEALDLIALHLDVQTKAGKPGYQKAVDLLAEATQLWRDKFKKKCPHCGKEVTLPS